MKNYLFIFVMSFFLLSCGNKDKSHIDKLDDEFLNILSEMSYHQYVDLNYYKFGYLVDRIVLSERCDGIVEIGNEKFSAILYEDGTYPYRLEGKEYHIYIDPVSPVDDSKFIVMKTWFRDQDKYHGSEIWE